MYHNTFQPWQPAPVEYTGFFALPQAQWGQYTTPTDFKPWVPMSIDTKPCDPNNTAGSGPLQCGRAARHSPVADQQPAWYSSKVPKKPRAIQACDQCRYRKQRCDEGTPCAFCKELDLDCTYRPPVPSKFDKMVDFMASWMSSHSEALRILSDKLDRLQNTLAICESRVNTARSDTPDVPIDHDRQHEPHRHHRCFQATTQHRIAECNNILSWSAVRDQLAKAQVLPKDEYIMEAEDRIQPLPIPAPATSRSCHNGFSADQVKTEYGTFLEHIYGRHPILNRCSVAKTLEGLTAERKRTPLADLSNDERPTKRRRLETCSPTQAVTSGVQQCPSTAVALLVLALGAVVQHETMGNSKAFCATDVEHDTKGTMEAVPGGQHYAEAMQSMAGLLDGTSLAHAQTFLLAGLYKARLARIKEASSWYSMAGRVLLHLIQRRRLCSDDAQVCLVQTHHSSRDDLVLRCAWSCLQLESAILPELRLPRSGLDQIERQLPLPTSAVQFASDNSGSTDKGHHMPLVCAARLRLMRLSSNVHAALQSATSTGTQRDLDTTLSKQISALQKCRDSLGSLLQWNDGDSSPHDVAMAGLRYDYWRTKLMLTRPYLDFILHNSVSHDHSLGEAKPELACAVRKTLDSTNHDEGFNHACQCIEAAKQSITAYENVTQPLIVDNIQTLAHNQFENVLLLAAAHHHKDLQQFISRKELEALATKTTDLLQQYSSKSPTCAADHKILTSFQQANFGIQWSETHM